MNKAMKKTAQKLNKSINIGEGFCFDSDYYSIKMTQEAIEYYNNNYPKIEDIIKNNNLYVAFDTNLLLFLYRVSVKERQEFLRFVDYNNERILIPSQVEEEFLSHRLQHIDSFRNHLKGLAKEVEEYPKKLKNSISMTIDKFKQLNNHRVICNDMPGVSTLITEMINFLNDNEFKEEFKEELEKKQTGLVEKLKDDTELFCDQYITGFKDDILKSISSCQILPRLNKNEIEFMKGKFQQCLDKFNEVKDDLNRKDHFVFPGCGDRKKIKENQQPYGDFYIYHELLSYIYREKRNVIFLTLDVAKSDWLKQDGKPFYHYIVDAYRNTNKMLYIFDANKIIPLAFEPIISDVDENEGDTTEQLSADSTDSLEANYMDGKDDIETVEVPLPYLRDISEERFLKELDISENWAKDFGDGDITVYYFIYQILRKKRFNFNTSKKIMKGLEEKNMIEIYFKNEKKCIRKKS